MNTAFSRAPGGASKPFAVPATVALAAVLMAGAGLSGAASADVTWEHAITVRLAGQTKPVVNFKVYNSWSGEKKRVLLKMAAGSMPLSGGLPTDPTFSMLNALQPSQANKAKKSGVMEFGYIQNFADDRMLAYSSVAREYYNEPLRATFKRVRFDPWKKRAPRLSQEAPPEFTPQQRARLGAEVRAVYSPYLKKGLKLYFRNLPTARTFNGIEARGHRLSWLVNAGNQRSPQWVRVNMEWWLGSEQAGDEEIRNYGKATRQFVRDMGGLSASMWLNEFYPVLWQMLPQEMHQAVATFLPTSGPRAGFGGTPLRFYLTVVPPALQRAALGGDLRAEAALLSRNTNPLNAAVFEAPQGFKKISLEPSLKQFEDLMQGNISSLPTELQPFNAMSLPWMGAAF
jgi:hypothetical protein